MHASCDTTPEFLQVFTIVKCIVSEKYYSIPYNGQLKHSVHGMTNQFTD